jgi:uncharacterized protein (DUF58 family)
MMVPLGLAAAAVVVEGLATQVILIDALFVVLFLVDALTLPPRKSVRLAREGQTNLSLGTKNRFALVVENRSRRRIYVSLTESCPAELDVSGQPAAGWVGASQRVAFRYNIVPRKRGVFSLGPGYLRARSLFGLWQRQVVVRQDHPLKVFPDVKLLNAYALVARRNRIDLLGFRQMRGRGSDAEFDRLREYQPDDDFRRIDPFASARCRKLITREYEVTRNQNIFFMIDCSRAMASESGGLSNLDHALNSVLMMSYVSLEFGDNVGLMAFAEGIRAFLPISSGLRSKTTILHALYDLKLSEGEPDYELAFLTLQKRVRQRALVVLLTNVMDAASFQSLRPQLRILLRRHLPLVLLMRDSDLFELADRYPQSLDEFYQTGAAAELATWREQLAGELQKQGSLVLDVQPSQSTPALINSYLKIKADQLL